MKTGEQLSNIPIENYYYNVTRMRTYKDKKKSHLAEWIYDSCISKMYTKSHISWKYTKNIDKIINNTIFFALALNENYGIGNIEEIIERMCQIASLEE